MVLVGAETWEWANGTRAWEEGGDEEEGTNPKKLN